MSEDTFYDICDAVETIKDNITEDYYPSIEKINSYVDAYGLEAQVELLAYYASNPFKRMNNPLADEPDYIATVKHCKKLLNSIALVTDL